MSKIIVIGSGFAGLSAACYLSAAGHDVHVYEKNLDPGGRARQLKTETGYVFDMGPSWYWMPDVFERFFNDLGYSLSDFYKLKLLDPSFNVVFSEQETLSIPANFQKLKDLFESIEAGSGLRLEAFMKDAEYKYDAGMKSLAYMPGLSITEFATAEVMQGAFKLNLFSSFSNHVRKYFKHPKLIALMEFPVLFLGAMPQDTPALYSLMNYAGLKCGTWYPEGGFGKIIEGMVEIAKANGCTFHFNAPVERINVINNVAESITVKSKQVSFDALVAAADYSYVEDELLDEPYRNYSNAYWNKKVFAPSCLIYYIGLNKKINSIQHHTLFFEEDLIEHSKEIYKNPQWPTKPLFYACCPSRSDESVAPRGHENLFLLMPIASDLEDNEAVREKYFRIMIDRLQKHIGEEIEENIDYKKSYCVSDFIADYNAYKGNAYGLANTLMQTAIFKPKVRNKKIKNLFYAGQLTVPGPGVPPSLISGKIAAGQIMKYLKSSRHETVI